jgi:hypothetical protein
MSVSSQLRFRTGTGVMAVGCFFTLLGLGMASLVMAMVCLVPSDQMNPWLRAALVLAALFPLSVAALGVLLTFGGTRVTLNGTTREVRITYGRWWPWKREGRSFDDFRGVQIVAASTAGFAGRTGPSGGGPSYPIRLLAAGDEVELWDGGSYKHARRRAEAVAELMQLPLHDESVAGGSIRAADALNESVRDSMRREGKRGPWPALPRNSRIQFEHRPGEIVIDLPRVSLREHRADIIGTAVLVVIWAGIAALGLFAFRGFLFGDDGPGWQRLVQAVLLSIPFLPAAMLTAGSIVLLSVRERLIVSPRMVRRVWRWPLGSWVRLMPIAELEELLIGDGHLVARSDRTTLRLGLMRSADEVRWLRDAIRYAISATDSTHA